jgi:hypothetical protein
MRESLFDECAAPLPPSQDAFERLWSVYPRSSGKIRARKAFDKAIKKTTIEKMLATVEWKKRTSQWRKVDPSGVHTYVPHLATWLNRGDYNDPMPTGMAAPSKPRQVSAEDRRHALDIRAAVDHREHIENMTAITSGEIYKRFPRLRPGSMKVTPCPCWKCRAARGE